MILYSVVNVKNIYYWEEMAKKINKINQIIIKMIFRTKTNKSNTLW